MSHYNKIAVKFKDAECLVKALNEMGYKEVERHSEPQTLYGYHGDARPEKAHVIVRRQFVGSAANDLGFIVGQNGEAIISDYDRSCTFQSNKLARLTQLYAKQVILKANKGKAVDVIEESNGRIRVMVRA